MIWLFTGLLCYLYLIVVKKNSYRELLNLFGNEEALAIVGTPIVMAVLGPLNIVVSIFMYLYGDKIVKED